MKCRNCDIEMKPGKALAQTFVGGSPDSDIGGGVMTFSAGGTGELVECLKCPSCGRSVQK